MKIKMMQKFLSKRDPQKVKFYKKKWLWAVLIVVLFFGVNPPDEGTLGEEVSVAVQSTEETLEVKETAEVEILDSNGEPIEFHPHKLVDDVTEKWRVSTIAENIQPEDYAIDYYNKYFESTDEVHWVVNFNYNTTTCISRPSGFLDVRVFEYTSKEEHSAKTLGSGMMYAEYFIDLATGEVEKIS